MSDASADRNLLYGVLAVQMDFISRDALIAAMNAWALEKTKPLGRILLEHQALSADEHDVLTALLHKHITRHGGDARESLIALGAAAKVPLDMADVEDPDLHASLVHLAAGTHIPPAFETTLISPDPQRADGERFEVLRPHASGGLGEVFVAQDHELNRQVALKRIHKRHSGNRDNCARFLQEAEITGGLEHPGIVPVYGLGKAADGRPHYAMRFIRGETLKAAIARFHASGSGSERSRRVELRQLLTRFAAVCNAIEYAHSRGVIHRDLKPSNIMLGKHGETLVVDWGLAKALRQRHEDPLRDEETLIPSSSSGSSETLPGSAIGTPGYMSPEQAAGRTAEVGPASDIYSLGATLYTLVTGVEPFEADEIGAVLERVQKGQFVPPRERSRAVPPALDAICLKAMRRMPGERYASCAALVSDVEHWLADEPVSAYRDPFHTRAARWVKQHRGRAAVGAAAAACVFVGLLVRTVVLSRANTEIATHAAEAMQQLYVSQLNLAQRAWDDNNVGRVHELLQSQTPEHTGGGDLRGWEWHYLWRLTHSELRVLQFMSLCLGFTPDGQYLVSGGEDGTLKMWTADGTREIWTITAHEQRVDRLAFSGDGRLLATRSPDGTVKLWEPETGRQLRSFTGARTRYGGLAISRDGGRLAASDSNAASIWSTETGELIRVVGTGPSSAIEFGPDSNQLAVASSQDFATRIWDLSTGDEHRKFVGHDERTTAVAFSPDGRTLAVGSRDGATTLWDIPSGHVSVHLAGHSDRINRVAFSDDGTQLATACDDTTGRIWDAATGEVLQTLRGHASPVSGVAYSPAADVVATGSWDGTIRLWDAASRQKPWSVARPGEVSGVAFSPDGKWLAAGGGGTIAVFDAETGLLRWSDSVPAASWSPSLLAFDPSGRSLAFGSLFGHLYLRNAEDGRPVNAFQVHDGPVTSVAFHPDGRLVATGSADRSVRLWDPVDGHQLAVLTGHADAVKSVAFSPDGKLLASAGFENDKQVILWDVATRQRLRSCVGHEGSIECITFNHDGRYLFSGSRDEMIRMLDVATGATVRIHRGHAGTVYSLSLSPDGRRVASCGSDQSVKIWDVVTGQELQTLKTDAGQLIDVAFSPDGMQLATGGTLRSLLVWDARPLNPELRNQIDSAARVQRLFATLKLQKDVMEALENDNSLSDSNRKLALELARRAGESPAELNGYTRSIVKQPELTTGSYALALRCAYRACELSPDNGALLNTLGVAEFRVGDYAHALESLSRSRELNEALLGGPIPADVAFLAMTFHHLGRAEDAAQHVDELRKLLATDPWKADAESQAFLKEADALTSPMEAATEPSPPALP